MADGEVFLNIGDVVRLRLPYSEACMSMQVAGKVMSVHLVGDDYPMAQLLKDDGSRWSFPILLGEAGIYTDSAGLHYVPARAVMPPFQVDLDGA